MFDDLIEQEEEYEIIDIDELCCENCDLASYILSNFPGTQVLCQRTGQHMLYKDWCEKWEQRTRVKPN